MYKLSIIILLALMAHNSFSARADSSDLIFDNTKIYTYELDFYVDDWEQQLKDNYDSGQLYMPAKFTYGNMVLDSIGVRYKGNSSYIMSLHTRKKPFKFNIDKYKGQTFFGVDMLNFSNCVKDPSFMRERISYEIARRYMPAPRTAYVNLYIEGELIGLYVQVEQIDKTFLRRYFDDNDFNLYKVGDQGGGLEYLGADQASYEAIYELKTNEVINDWSAFITMIEKLNNTPASVFVDTINNYLNLESCINILAFNMTFSHFDSYTGSGRNYYFYDDSISSQFHMILWDLNETFGAYTNNWNVITQDIISISNIDNRPLNKRILENDSLKQVYLKNIHTMIHGLCVLDTIAAMADRIKPLIESHVLADQNKLYTDQNFIDNIENDVYMGPQGTIPGIKSFTQKRNAELQTQLDKYMIIPIISDLKNPALYGMMLRNVPNPFTSTTRIHYKINGGRTSVKISVYNFKGETVTSFDEGFRSPGTYTCIWDAGNLSPGYYIIKLDAGAQVTTQHAIVLQ